MDNRVRFLCCLLATALILASAPFLWGPPEVVTTVHAAIQPTNPTPLPSVKASTPPAATPNSAPVKPQETITDNQRYVESLVTEDSTNILICAPDPSAWNMDTIMIASISPSSGKVSLISLPRDIYISYSDSLAAALEKVSPGLIDQPGMRKINAAHSIGDKLKYKEGTGRFDRPYLEFLADLLEEVFDIHIDDYIYVQTKGFRRIVDYFGGVTIKVPVRMFYEDPTQDLLIDLQPGSQQLDGLQAEGFVRFRQGYADDGTFHNYGDFFRKENQSKFFKSFLQQHLTLGNLTRLSDISEFVGKNIITSIKGWDRIVRYGAMAETVLAGDYPIESVKLREKEVSINHLSYVRLEEAPKPETELPPGIMNNDGLPFGIPGGLISP